MVEENVIERSEDANICDVDALESALNSIKYKIPEGYKRVPWVEKLDILTKNSIPSDLDSRRDIDREGLIQQITLETTRDALTKLKYLNLPFARPHDYYAEMIKSDEFMKIVHSKLKSKH